MNILCLLGSQILFFKTKRQLESAVKCTFNLIFLQIGNILFANNKQYADLFVLLNMLTIQINLQETKTFMMILNWKTPSALHSLCKTISG